MSWSAAEEGGGMESSGAYSESSDLWGWGGRRGLKMERRNEGRSLMGFDWAMSAQAVRNMLAE